MKVGLGVIAWGIYVVIKAAFCFQVGKKNEKLSYRRRTECAMDSASPDMNTTSKVSIEEIPKISTLTTISASTVNKEVVRRKTDPPEPPIAEDTVELMTSASSSAVSSSPEVVGRAVEAEKAEPPEADVAEEKAKKKVEDEETIARRLEQAINKFATPFKVSFAQGDAGLRFQVIEAETGKVIREYPPGEIDSIMERLESGQPGVIVDTAA